MIAATGRERVVLSILLVALTFGFARMSAWSLRGRDTHAPRAGAADGNPTFDPEDLPLRGRSARWAGAGFLLMAVILLVAVVRLWW
jgi:hypothetical protein